jgi:hypothetical protein
MVTGKFEGVIGTINQTKVNFLIRLLDICPTSRSSSTAWRTGGLQNLGDLLRKVYHPLQLYWHFDLKWSNVSQLCTLLVSSRSFKAFGIAFQNNWWNFSNRSSYWLFMMDCIVHTGSREFIVCFENETIYCWSYLILHFEISIKTIPRTSKLKIPKQKKMGSECIETEAWWIANWMRSEEWWSPWTEKFFEPKSGEHEYRLGIGLTNTKSAPEHEIGSIEND